MKSNLWNTNEKLNGGDMRLEGNKFGHKLFIKGYKALAFYDTSSQIFAENLTKEENFKEDSLLEVGSWQEPEVLIRLEDPTKGEQKIFTCYHCSFEWEDLKILKTHIKNVHLPFLKKCGHDNNFNAENCDRKKLFECPHCDYKCAKPKTLKKHIKVKHKDTKPCECTHCKFSTFYPKVLKRHIRSKHPFIKPYACNICTYSSYEEYDLKVHVIKDHTNKLLHFCPFCGYISGQCSSLMAHIKGKHPDEGLYQCQLCSSLSLGTIFSDREKTKENVCLTKSTSVTSSPKPVRVATKTHFCPQCDYKTPQLAHLKRHIISNHTCERPYQCVHCPYSTSRSDHLRKHVANKHANEDTYHCGDCLFASPHATDLKLHIKLNHPHNKFNDYFNGGFYSTNSKGPIPDKCFKCAQCEYMTRRQDNLKRHLIAQHTNFKCYQCSFCIFSTYRSDKLKRHMNARHSEQMA